MNEIKSRILIVDDSMDQTDFLTEILIDKYDIICAYNGNQAIELAGKHPKPDLILLDIIIPEPDGYKVCSILKASDETKHIPIILITGLSSEHNARTGLKSGAIDYIKKPYDIQLMRNRIKRHLDLKESRR
ncbi:MAG: response regulator [Spirochaetaceae bacterium]|nr:response regulator [Spirochaetaceae bacterium]